MADKISEKDFGDQNDNRNEENVMSELLTYIDDFLQTVQSNKSKATHCNGTSNEIAAPSDIIRLPTDDRDVGMKQDSEISGNHQNELQVPKQNRINDDSGGLGQAEKRTIQNDYNDLTIAGSIEKLLSTDEIETIRKLERKKSIISTNSFQKPFENLRSQKIPFPQVLHRMLETAKENGYDEIFSWQNHGRSFRVIDKKLFVTTIMARYFNQTQYTSFQRQLALYGFVRLTKKSSEDFGSYYHERFLRGYPELACIMQRTAVKGAGTQRISATETGPDFKTMRPAGIDDSVEVKVAKVMSKETNKLEINRFVNEQTFKHQFSEIDSVHDRKLPATIVSGSNTSLNQDSSKTIDARENDNQNVVDDSANDSMTTDDDEGVENHSMVEFLSDVDL